MYINVIPSDVFACCLTNLYSYALSEINAKRRNITASTSKICSQTPCIQGIKKVQILGSNNKINIFTEDGDSAVLVILIINLSI